MKRLGIIALCTAVSAVAFSGCSKENVSDTAIYDSPENEVIVTVTEISGQTMIVSPVSGSSELKSSDKFTVGIENLPDGIIPEVDDSYKIEYSGGILETYPAQFGNIIEIKEYTHIGQFAKHLIIAVSSDVTDYEAIFSANNLKEAGALALSENDTEFLKNINMNWAEGTSDCLSDIVFLKSDKEGLYYHSECGTINDNINNRSCVVSDSERERLNAIVAELIEKNKEKYAFAENGTVGSMEYSVIESNQYSDQRQRGYTIKSDGSSNTCVCTISSGERSSGGYSIRIADLQADGDGLVIVVEETSPSPDSTVTSALTYPSVSISVKPEPNKVTVKDINAAEFELLSSSIAD